MTISATVSKKNMNLIYNPSSGAYERKRAAAISVFDFPGQTRF